MVELIEIRSDVRCKTCTSRHRLWIERLRGDGIPCDVISAKLKQEHGEEITGESLRRHFRKHVDLQRALQERYAASEALADVAAGRRLSDVQRLDAVIDDSSRRSAELGERIDVIVSEGKAPPMAIVEAYKAATAEMRQAIKQKNDLLGDSPADGVDRLLSALWGGEQSASDDEPEPAPADDEEQPESSIDGN